MDKDNDTKANAMQKQKKISFFSAILVVMGSSIGAGIFFKSEVVLDNSQGSLIMAIFCWIIAAFSVIAMGLALIEIASARNDNLSIIGWNKVFNSRTLFKASKNFMLYLYLPLNFFYMPLYLIQSLQDGVGALINKPAFILGTSVDWLIWTIISIAICAYFMLVAGLSSKAGDVQNKVITCIKFIPLGAVTLIGIILVGMNAGGSFKIGFTPPMVDINNSPIKDSIQAGASTASFVPAIGMFLSICAIFFAYDGFYVVSGIQTEIKEPKKTPLVILLGLVITTIVYLFLAISMSINGGSFPNMREYMENEWGEAGKVIFGVINIMIAIGIMGIINSFAIWMPRFGEDLMSEGEVPFAIKFKNKLNDKRPVVGVVFYMIWTYPLIIIFSIIGALAYIDNYGTNYGSGMGKLYSFADLISTWMSVFVFLFIVASIFGGIRNRKTNKVSTSKYPYFLIFGWISIVMITLSATITILMPFIDMFLIPILDKSLVESVGRNYTDIVVGRIILIVVLIIYVFLTFGLTWIEDRVHIKKFGSIKKYEEWQRKNFNVS